MALSAGGAVAEGPADEGGEVDGPLFVEEMKRRGVGSVGAVACTVGREGEAQGVRGVPDGLWSARGGGPGSELELGVVPEVGVGHFGAEEPGFAGDEEEVVDRGEGGEMQGVVGEEGFAGGVEGGERGGGEGGRGAREEAGLDLDLAALDDG